MERNTATMDRPPTFGPRMRIERDEHGRPRAVPDESTPYLPALPTSATSDEEADEGAPTSGTGTPWRVWRHTDAEPGTTPAYDALTPSQRLHWFGAYAGDEGASARAWRGVVAWVAQTFPGCHAMYTPGLTGLICIEHTLPWGKGQPVPYRYAALPDTLGRLIAGTSTQHRMEMCAAPGALVRRYLVYDARVAFGGYLRNLPIVTDEGAQHDELPTYEHYRAGRYRVDVTVPPAWDRVGLAPRRRPGGMGWEWPARPGESWEAWLDEGEMRLLEEWAWPYAVRERVLFAPSGTPGSDPLREYAGRVATEIERVEQVATRTPALNAYRAALRALVIHPVGMWNRQGSTSERHVSTLDELTPEDAEADIVPAPGGGYTITNRAALTPFTSRWRRPEWAAAVYARERVTATRKALELPRAALLAIRGDALHLRESDPGWQDTGKVGIYRKQLDHTFTRARKAPMSAAALIELHELAEKESR